MLMVGRTPQTLPFARPSEMIKDVVCSTRKLYCS